MTDSGQHLQRQAEDREAAQDAEAMRQERIENQDRAILSTFFDSDKVEEIISDNKINIDSK